LVFAQLTQARRVISLIEALKRDHIRETHPQFKEKEKEKEKDTGAHPNTYTYTSASVEHSDLDEE